MARLNGQLRQTAATTSTKVSKRDDVNDDLARGHGAHESTGEVQRRDRELFIGLIGVLNARNLPTKP